MSIWPGGGKGEGEHPPYKRRGRETAVPPCRYRRELSRVLPLDRAALAGHLENVEGVMELACITCCLFCSSFGHNLWSEYKAGGAVQSPALPQPGPDPPPPFAGGQGQGGGAQGGGGRPGAAEEGQVGGPSPAALCLHPGGRALGPCGALGAATPPCVREVLDQDARAHGHLPPPRDSRAVLSID